MNVNLLRSFHFRHLTSVYVCSSKMTQSSFWKEKKKHLKNQSTFNFNSFEMLNLIAYSIDTLRCQRQLTISPILITKWNESFLHLVNSVEEKSCTNFIVIFKINLRKSENLKNRLKLKLSNSHEKKNKNFDPINHPNHKYVRICHN